MGIVLRLQSDGHGVLVEVTRFAELGVVESVAVRASKNHAKLQRTIRRLQQIRFKALAITKYQQLSIGSGTRFGTRFPTL